MEEEIVILEVVTGRGKTNLGGVNYIHLKF